MTGRAATSSSIHYQWTYDVFINFRGEDTRHGFTGNLYCALKNAGVRTFIDDEELRKGDEITPTLLKAIQDSRMAITVFSKNYASSTFCLNELVKIHQCIKREDRLVLPIFYDVEPSEVRHQKGNYEQALTMHKINFKADEEKTQSWKRALLEVANISGLHVNPRHGYEFKFIDKIVKEISSKINRVPLYVAEYPVGLDSRVQQIKSLLQIGSNNKVNMVGICGIGGIGKTTIARAMYNSVADVFESLCFLCDIKGNSEKLGLERIQESMLSKILGVDIKIEDVNEGVEIIKMRLKQKKVLLILDNVDKHEQLKKIAGDCNWFGVGSRIIITTRDRHLFARHGVETIYDMEAFNDKESLELLNWNAFRNNQVIPSHTMVLNHAISYAKGLPLALEVIGSNLCGMSINEWESALVRYKRIPNEDIQQVLKVSYDGLTQDEKEIFVDIACFFKGTKLEYVKDMVKHVHDFDPSYGIRVLEDKCLIKIGTDGIEMHDLIQDMGREVVRQESPKEPGKRSRLWFNQDIVHVLEKDTGTNEVSIIIQVNLLECIEVDWDGEAFKNMKNLKILIFENVKFSKSPKYLSNSLKVLKWRGYPFSCLPPHFCPEKLVVFDLKYSCLSSLETLKNWKNLSILNLEKCQSITQIPDLSNLHDLKELNLGYCKNLIEIHDSVGFLAKLKILDVENCVRLRNFPRHIRLPSLEELKLFSCSSLEYFPEILENMKMEFLYFSGTGIKKLPWSICKLTQLKELLFWSNKGMIELPRSIFQLSELEEIALEGCGEWLSSNSKEAQAQVISSMLSPKRIVTLRECNISDELLQTYFPWFINVIELDLTGNNFTILPAWIKECQFLNVLVLNECKHLREVEGLPPNIEYLRATNCISLSLESKSLLLSEEFHGAAIRHYSPNVFFKYPTEFWVPTTSIPHWFDHSSKGSIISFWYQYYFPPLCLCVLIKSMASVADYNAPHYLNVEVYINNEVVHRCGLSEWRYSDWYLDRVYRERVYHDHIILYNLKSDILDDKKMKRACPKWSHVRICVYPEEDDCMVIEESGIYVVKELYMMGDIQFTDPYEQRLDFISGDQDVIWNNTIIRPSTEEEENDDFFISTKEKEPMLDKKRPLIQDDNSATCSHVFRSTKRGRNCPVNLDDDDTRTTEIQYGNVSETIGNQVNDINNGYNWLSDNPYSEATFIDLDANNTSLPMLPLMEQASDTTYTQGYSIEDNKWLPMLPLSETPLYHGSTSHQEFQQRQDVTPISVEQIPESSEDNRKAKGKEIVIYDDHKNGE